MLQNHICQQCGRSFQGGPRAYYCSDCRQDRQREQWRNHKKYGPSRPLGSTGKCEQCGKDYIVNAGLQRYCPDCQPIHARNYDQQTSIIFYRNNKERINPLRNERRRKGPRKCAQCGKLFTALTRTVTCSPECRRQYSNDWWRKRYHRPNCVICGKKIPAKSKGKKICSRECFKKLCKLNLTGNYKPYDPVKSQKASIKAWALAWTIKTPENIVYRPYDLMGWFKKHSDLLPGTPKQAAVAFYQIHRGYLQQWHGWELVDVFKPAGNIEICSICGQWHYADQQCRHIFKIL